MDIAARIFTGLFSAFCMVLGAKQPNESKESHWIASSTCPGSVSQTEIAVLEDKILTPAHLTFTAFGLPSPTTSIQPKNKVEGIMSGIERVCKADYFNRVIPQDGEPRIIVFTCRENNVEVCQATFEFLSIY